MKLKHTRLAAVAASLGLAAGALLAQQQPPASPAPASPGPTTSPASPATRPARPARPPAPKANNAAQATPVENLRVAAGFKVELLHTVPADTQGSWVAMCVDPKGRLIVSDQYGALYRVTPPPVGGRGRRDGVGGAGEAIKIEKIPAKVGMANGLLWAFDSLYVVVNNYEKPADNGVYRVRDTDGNDELDSVELLRTLADGGGTDHGPHAAVLAPDGKSIFIVVGNRTSLAQIEDSRVPRRWGEDHLLPADARRPRVHAGQARPRREHLPDVPGRQALDAVRDRLPQPVRRGVQPGRRAVHVRRRHGVRLQHELVPPDPDQPRGQRRRVRVAERGRQVAGLVRGQRRVGPRHRPRVADRRRVRVRGQVPGQVPERPVRRRLELGKRTRST
jgi:hypothetical protein